MNQLSHRGTAGNSRVVPVRLVYLSANSGAAGTPAKTPVKLTKAQAREKALKLLSKVTGETPEALAAKLPGQAAPAATPANQPPDLIALERKRRTDIESLATIYKLDEKFVNLAVSQKWDLPTVQTNALKAMADNNPAVQIRVGEDQRTVSLSATISTAIRLRAQARCGMGRVEKPTDAVGLSIYERAQRFQGMSLVDMGRQYLSAVGYGDTAFLTPARVIRLCMNRSDLRNEPNGGRLIMLAESIGDFPG